MVCGAIIPHLVEPGRAILRSDLTTRGTLRSCQGHRWGSSHQGAEHERFVGWLDHRSWYADEQVLWLGVTHSRIPCRLRPRNGWGLFISRYRVPTVCGCLHACPGQRRSRAIRRLGTTIRDIPRSTCGGTTGAMYTTIQGTNGVWCASSSLNGSFTSAPRVQRDYQARSAVFGIGTDHALHRSSTHEPGVDHTPRWQWRPEDPDRPRGTNLAKMGMLCGRLMNPKLQSARSPGPANLTHGG